MSKKRILQIVFIVIILLAVGAVIWLFAAGKLVWANEKQVVANTSEIICGDETVTTYNTAMTRRRTRLTKLESTNSLPKSRERAAMKTTRPAKRFFSGLLLTSSNTNLRRRQMPRSKNSTKSIFMLIATLLVMVRYQAMSALFIVFPQRLVRNRKFR